MTALGQRCPTCNAHVTAEAQWCTLCYADLRPRVEPVAEPATAPAASAGLAGQLDHPFTIDDNPLTFGTPSRAADGDLEAAQLDAAAQADLMLAQLAATSDEPLKGLGRNFESNAAKVALIAGGSIVVLIVLFALMFLVGSQIKP